MVANPTIPPFRSLNFFPHRHLHPDRSLKGGVRMFQVLLTLYANVILKEEVSSNVEMPCTTSSLMHIAYRRRRDYLAKGETSNQAWKNQTLKADPPDASNRNGSHDSAQDGATAASGQYS